LDEQRPPADLFHDASPEDDTGAPFPIYEQQQQFARNMQAMTTESNPNPHPEFPPASVPELEYNGPAAELLYEEEVSPLFGRVTTSTMATGTMHLFSKVWHT
jgi:hypothetical protein